MMLCTGRKCDGWFKFSSTQQRYQHFNWCNLFAKSVINCWKCPHYHCCKRDECPIHQSLTDCYAQVTQLSTVSRCWHHRPSSLPFTSKCRRFSGQFDFNVVFRKPKIWRGEFCNLTFEKPKCFTCAVHWNAVLTKTKIYRHLTDSYNNQWDTNVSFDLYAWSHKTVRHILFLSCHCPWEPVVQCCMRTMQCMLQTGGIWHRTLRHDKCHLYQSKIMRRNPTKCQTI